MHTTKKDKNRTPYRVLISIYVLLSILFILLLFLQENRFLKNSRLNLDSHCQVLSNSLWKIDNETTYQYMKLASRTDNYLMAEVFLHPETIPFVTIDNSSLNSLEIFFLRVRLYRSSILLLPVNYESNEIGIIKVKILNKNTLYYLFEGLMVFIFGILISKIISKIQKANVDYLESESRFKTLIENMPGISYRCLLDKDWTMQFISDEVEHVTGYSSDDLIMNKKLSYYSIIDPIDSNRVTQSVHEALSKKIPFMIEYKLICKDGTSRWIYERGQGIFGKSGEVKYIDGVIFDISDQKKMKNEIDELELQFHRAQKMESIGIMAGGIAHDFNNFLTPILGYTDLLKSEAQSGKNELTIKFLNEIFEASIKAKDLANQLLSYSRRQDLIYKTLSLNVLLESLQGLLYGTLKDNIKLEMNLDKTLPPILGNPGQLEQVILNLAVNAQDAMPKGGVLSIKTSVSERLEGEVSNTYVSLSISDNGCGIDPKIKANIFKPFYSTKGDQGTGLGLATVYRIVHQLGGTIEVESELGMGSEFLIELPSGENK